MDWKRFSIALVAQAMVVGIFLLIGFAFLSDQNSERAMAIVFPLPHLFWLTSPFTRPLWGFGAAQVIAYSSIIGFKRFFVVAAIAAVGVIHLVGIMIHLSIRGLVP